MLKHDVGECFRKQKLKTAPARELIEGFGMRGGTYQKIMVATDGSELCKKAVETGIEIARLSGAKLYAVYVVIPATHSARDFGGKKPQWNTSELKGRKLQLSWKNPLKLQT